MSDRGELAIEFWHAVEKAPSKFAAGALASKDPRLVPTFVEGLFSYLVTAAQNRVAWEWSPVLELANWALSLDINAKSMRQTREAILSLLTKSFEASAGDAAMPIEQRDAAWRVIEPLTSDPDVGLERVRYEGDVPDVLGLVFSGVRNTALRAAINYGLWVRRTMNTTPAGQAIPRTFLDSGLTGLQEALEQSLDPSANSAPAIRAFYGQWFPWMFHLDEKWATNALDQIFPSDSSLEAARDVAWTAYVVLDNPYNDILETLTPQYRLAIERAKDAKLGSHSDRDPNFRLAQHLMVYFWRGKLPLEDGLIPFFFDTASPELRESALAFVGSTALEDPNEIPKEMRDRMMSLWESRLEVARASGEVDELAAFGWWFASDKFPRDWSLRQLTECLKLRKNVDVPDQVVEKLAEMAAEFPEESIDALGRLVPLQKDAWEIPGWQENPDKIIKAALGSGNANARARAIEVINDLGARGHFGFRGLLPKE